MSERASSILITESVLSKGKPGTPSTLEQAVHIENLRTSYRAGLITEEHVTDGLAGKRLQGPPPPKRPRGLRSLFSRSKT